MNAKCVYRIMHQNELILERKSAIPFPKWSRDGKVKSGDDMIYWKHSRSVSLFMNCPKKVI